MASQPDLKPCLAPRIGRNDHVPPMTPFRPQQTHQQLRFLAWGYGGLFWGISSAPTPDISSVDLTCSGLRCWCLRR